MVVINRKIVVETDARIDEGFISVYNITPRVLQLVGDVSFANGILTLFLPATTAALGTIEFEDGLIADFKKMWQRIVPQDIDYRHKFSWDENNAHSHVRASLMGASLVVPLINKRIILGQYQQIVLVEFDNRNRNRQIVAQFMGE
jgi:secondary thiamine-phosphate synthase enzyme